MDERVNIAKDSPISSNLTKFGPITPPPLSFAGAFPRTIYTLGFATHFPFDPIHHTTPIIGLSAGRVYTGLCSHLVIIIIYHNQRRHHHQKIYQDSVSMMDVARPRRRRVPADHVINDDKLTLVQINSCQKCQVIQNTVMRWLYKHERNRFAINYT